MFDTNATNESAILIEEEYTKEKIIEGLNTSLDDCIPESEVEWQCIKSIVSDSMFCCNINYNFYCNNIIIFIIIIIVIIRSQNV